MSEDRDDAKIRGDHARALKALRDQYFNDRRRLQARLENLRSKYQTSKSTRLIMSVKDIRFTYVTRVGMFKRFVHCALDGISFGLRKGETLGILGRNGSGKSTLLRLLAGVVDPSSGEVECAPETTRALLTLGLGFRSDLSGSDNAVLSAMLQGSSKDEAVAALPSIKEFSELGSFFEQPVKTYSAGMRSRLGFATAMNTNVDVLLIDEALGAGDAHFRQKATDAMANRIKNSETVVLVSHNGSEVQQLCDRALWLEHGVIRMEGNAQVVGEKYNESAT